MYEDTFAAQEAAEAAYRARPDEGRDTALEDYVADARSQEWREEDRSWRQ